MTSFVIEGGHPLNGSVRVSGNKNEALPAIMASLLTEDTVTLHRLPRIRDVETALELLAQLGADYDWIGPSSVSICTKKVTSHRPNAALCEKIRASILLIGPLLSRFGKVELPSPGGDVIGARRIDSHFDGVRSLGGKIVFGNPITGSIEQLRGGEVFLDEPSVTATENVLMLCAVSSGVTYLYNAACEPHVVGLCRLLNAMGAKIYGVGSNLLRIEGVSELSGCEHTIGPDFMEVGSFLCLGAITPGRVSIDDINVSELRFVLKTLDRIGIQAKIDKANSLKVSTDRPDAMKADVTGRVGTIYSGPWPAFPTDLMSVAIVAATQAEGTIIFHEKMFEGRMFFTDRLLDMGANIVLCDPHRIVVTGRKELKATNMSSPDVRAGMAMVMAALCAKGKSVIDNVYQIERGYDQVLAKLIGLGAKIRALA